MTILNLYRFHSETDKLAGYNDQSRIPMLVARELFNRPIRGSYSTDDFLQELRRKRGILGQDPATAVDAAIRYRNAAYSLGPNSSLFNRNPNVERVIATDPNSITRYLTWVVGQTEPRYHEQILKSSIASLEEYLRHFKYHLKDHYPEFLKEIYEKIASDPESAFTLGIGSGDRNLDLEPGIFRFEPSKNEWHNILGESEFMALPQTPAAGGQDYINSFNMHKYAEYDSPWNLYVSSLTDVKDRIAAVQQYGFKGREFDLGNNNEPR